MLDLGMKFLKNKSSFYVKADFHLPISGARARLFAIDVCEHMVNIILHFSYTYAKCGL